MFLIRKNVALISILLLSYGASVFAANQIDREIVAFLITANTNEINAAKSVKDRVESPKVKSFANMMIKDHSKNLEDTQKISKNKNIKPLENISIKELEKAGKKEVSNFSKLSGKKLDKNYINAMVKGHKEVLHKVDNYLKKVHNPALKTHLQKTRARVSDHLQESLSIQKTQ